MPKLPHLRMPDFGPRIAIPGFGSINRYVFRTTFGAFAIVLFSLTSVIWITQALRDIDLMTSRGQTVLVFLGITGLVIPMLVLVIAPVALMIAVMHSIGRLSNDSELIVMNAAGMSPWALFRPFLFLSIFVAALMTVIGAWLGPLGMQTLNSWANEVRADLVSNVVQPGRFNGFERGLVFHIRERQANGQLLGVFVDDRRNPKERATFVAEQGTIVKDERGSFMILETGNVQRLEIPQRQKGQKGPLKPKDPTVVIFERYALDLAQAQSDSQTQRASARDRYFWELLANDPEKTKIPAGMVRAEMNDRIFAPLYPLVFTIITFAYLGAPRTTRQGRAVSIASAAIVIATIRLFGFVVIVLCVRYPWVLAIQYLVLAVAAVLGLYAIHRGLEIEPPAFIMKAINAVTELLSRFGQRPAAAAT